MSSLRLNSTLLAALLILSFLTALSAAANPVLTPGVWVNITPPYAAPTQTHYGCNDVVIDPKNPFVLYVCVDQAGLWKSSDAGTTWKRLGDPAKCGFNGTIGYLDSPLHLYIDPKDSQHLIAAQGVRGKSVGFWISEDGGNTWTMPASFLSGCKTWTNDLYDCPPDPSDFNHILISFHSGWNAKGSDGNSGVLETTDGGVTWIPHSAAGKWGAGLTINFLYNPAQGIGNRNTWLLGTQWGGGYYRTTDGGATWTNVSTIAMQHGGIRTFYAKNGVLYAGADNQIMRSTDNGATWTLVGPRFNDGYYCVIGDGNNLYAQEANTGGNSTGKPQPYITSLETDGVNWTPYNGGSQTFTDGPYRMAFDPVNRIIYSANWNAGVWALKVTDPRAHQGK